MQVSIQQICNILRVYNSPAELAIRAFAAAGVDGHDAAASVSPAQLESAKAAMAKIRAEYLNVDTIKASPVLEMMGGFEGVWDSYVDQLNQADRVVAAVGELAA